MPIRGIKKMGSILVTGGAGYIGSHTVQELIKDGHEIIVVDNLSTGFKNSLPNNIKFYNEDINNYFSLSQIVKKHAIDLVLHCAGKIIVSESMEKPFLYYKENIEGLRVLLEVMVNNSINNIIFSSTASVYGNNCVEYSANEETGTNPINVYAETKLIGENLIKFISEKYKINYLIFRYFNVAGASLDGRNGLSMKNPTHLIPNTIKVALGVKDELVVFGNDYNTKDGTCIRDYIHVLDLAKAHSLGVDYLLDGKQSNIFNLGTEKGYSVNEIILYTEKFLNVSINYKYEKRREGDPASVLANSEKANKILEWNPIYTLKDIIESDYLWRKNFPNGHNE